MNTNANVSKPIQPMTLLPAIPQSLQTLLPEPILKGYDWHRPEHEQQFFADLKALGINVQMGWTTQIQQYKERIIDLFHQDQVSRVHDLIRAEFGHRGHFYHAPHAVSNGNQFTELIGTRRRKNNQVRISWRYMPVDSFSQLIPLAALERVLFLEQQGIEPDAYWVAEKREERIYADTRRLRDPLLCVSFGRWVVSIAVWE